MLKSELITLAELQAAARKQGFGALDEIERAVLDPGGTISFVGTKPEPGSERFHELAERLERIAGDVSDLKRGLLPQT